MFLNDRKAFNHGQLSASVKGTELAREVKMFNGRVPTGGSMFCRNTILIFYMSQSPYIEKVGGTALISQIIWLELKVLYVLQLLCY